MNNSIKEDVVDKIKSEVDIVDFISEYIHLKKSGTNYMGLCPFHSEKTPSFSVSPSKEIFHCFGCGEGGDAISFLMKKENLDFIEAIKFLGDKYGIEVNENQERDKNKEINSIAYEINREAARFFYKNLVDSKLAKDYLLSRSLSPNTIKKFGLGYAEDSWDSLVKYLDQKGYDLDLVEKIGLIGKKNSGNGYYDKFRNRIMFPIIDIRSKIIGFGGRVLDDSMPKYLNSKESTIYNKGHSLYGLNIIKGNENRKKILLVEGYMDVISLFEKGINYSVASLGTALTSRQAKLLKRFGEEVYICYDSDEAGRKATLRAIDVLVSESINPRVVILPSNMDPDEYISKYGNFYFDKLFFESLNHIEYKIYLMKGKYDLNNFEEKIEFTQEISKIIKKISSPIEQDVYIDKIALETEISKEAIIKEIRGKNYKANYPNKYNKKNDKSVDIQPVKIQIESAYIKAELELISFMIEDKDYFDLINHKINIEEYLSKESKLIYRTIGELYEEKNQISIEDLLEARIKDFDESLISNLKNFEITYQTIEIERVIIDLIEALKRNRLNQERDEILKKIEILDRKKDKTSDENLEFNNLCNRLIGLNNKIKSIRHD